MEGRCCDQLESNYLVKIGTIFILFHVSLNQHQTIVCEVHPNKAGHGT